MRLSLLGCLMAAVFFVSCRDVRIKEQDDWGKYFTEHGIDSACFILRDNNHESVHYYNKDRCLERFSPASTFKIFNSLVALEIPVAPDERLVIKWDSVERWNADWNKDMDMREAFKVSNLGYYQELARRIGKDYMQYYLDTVQYGNEKIGDSVDKFWLDGSLQISADEQLGFIKKLYFGELPFKDRTQRIVRSMMLQEEGDGYKLYYKTGWSKTEGKPDVMWVVGFAERIEKVDEPEGSMNKSNIRLYPYFFAMNFDKPANEKNWAGLRIDILKSILQQYGALPDRQNGQQ